MTGQTRTVRTDYEPWFLGFCRWDIKRITVPAIVTINGVSGVRIDQLDELIAAGSWRWRGLGARFRRTVMA